MEKIFTGKPWPGVESAASLLKAQLQGDPHYAWSWHCNIAMAMIDEGLDPEKANKGAARFMKLAFNVDTSKEPT